MKQIVQTPTVAFVRKLPEPCSIFGKHLKTLIDERGLESSIVDKITGDLGKHDSSFADDVIEGVGYYTFIKSIKVTNYFNVSLQSMFDQSLERPVTKVHYEHATVLIEQICYNLKREFLESSCSDPAAWCSSMHIPRHYILLPPPFPPYAGYPSVLYLGRIIESLDLKTYQLEHLFGLRGIEDAKYIDGEFQTKFRRDMEDCITWLHQEPEIVNKKFLWEGKHGTHTEYLAFSHVVKEANDTSYENSTIESSIGGHDVALDLKRKVLRSRPLVVKVENAEEEKAPISSPVHNLELPMTVAEPVEQTEPATSKKEDEPLTKGDAERVVRSQIECLMALYDTLFTWVPEEDRPWCKIHSN
jgi:hypothetical protein